LAAAAKNKCRPKPPHYHHPKATKEVIDPIPAKEPPTPKTTKLPPNVPKTVPPKETTVVVPTKSVLPPKQTTVLPPKETVAPTKSVLPPKETVVPTKSFLPPKQTTVYPTIIPSIRTIEPDLPPKQTVAPTKSVLPPKQTTVLPPKETVAPTKSVLPPKETVAPTKSVLPPKQTTVLPPKETVAPTKSVLPPKETVAPTKSVLPPKETVAPTKSVLPPKQTSVLPPKETVAPTKSVLPPKETVAPTKSVLPPKQTSVLPPKETVAPTKSVLPPKETVAPTKSVLPPKETPVEPSKPAKKEYIKGANPYLPMWEHIPDGEPRVFEYNGEQRVFIYGSHDTLKTEYCGKDQVTWSAPVDDLTNWTYHGVIFESIDGSNLYAPDVVKKGDTYYLYAAQQNGGEIYVATSKSPAGPFTDPKRSYIGFDPGVLVDDDGRVYAYWGFSKQYCAELEDDMITIKEGTIRENVIKHAITDWSPDDGADDPEDAFFEASSPRKVFGKYVYIYSKRYYTPQPQYGVYEDCNGFLSYKYSDEPLDNFVMGGDFSFNAGELLDNDDGTKTMTYRWGNNHGSIVEINGQWYVFYHRQTGVNEYSRQAMLEPIDVAMDKNGKIFIGKITYDEDGEPIASEPVEMTSQGAHVNGLDSRKLISAGYACHLFGGKKGGANGGQGGAYILPVYEKDDTISAPIVDITSTITAGYKYIQFGETSPSTVTAEIKALADITVNVRIDSYQGEIIATFDMKKGDEKATAELINDVTGKKAVYFEFLSDSPEVIAEFNLFTFDD